MREMPTSCLQDLQDLRVSYVAAQKLRVDLKNKDQTKRDIEKECFRKSVCLWLLELSIIRAHDRQSALAKEVLFTLQVGSKIPRRRLRVPTCILENGVITKTNDRKAKKLNR